MEIKTQLELNIAPDRAKSVPRVIYLDRPRSEVLLAMSWPSVTLDGILTHATEQWREWRAEHPMRTPEQESAMTIEEQDALGEQDYEEQNRIVDALIPEDKAGLIGLAVDDRVWEFDDGHALQGRNLADVVHYVITELFYAQCNACDEQLKAVRS